MYVCMHVCACACVWVCMCVQLRMETSLSKGPVITLSGIGATGALEAAWCPREISAIKNMGSTHATHPSIVYVCGYQTSRRLLVSEGELDTSVGRCKNGWCRDGLIQSLASKLNSSVCGKCFQPLVSRHQRWQTHSSHHSHWEQQCTWCMYVNVVRCYKSWFFIIKE